MTESHTIILEQVYNLTPRLSALHNLIDWAKRAVDNNDRITAKAVLTNAEHVVLAMMENGK